MTQRIKHLFEIIQHSVQGEFSNSVVALLMCSMSDDIPMIARFVRAGVVINPSISSDILVKSSRKKRTPHKRMCLNSSFVFFPFDDQRF